MVSDPSNLINSLNVDAILLDCKPSEQIRLGSEALQGGKAVLLVKPLQMTPGEARQLTEVAKGTKGWLGILCKQSKKDKASLRWIADEAARCKERGLSESPQLVWEDHIAVLEILQELREMGTLPSTGFSTFIARTDSQQSPEASTSSPEVPIPVPPISEPELAPATTPKQGYFPNTDGTTMSQLELAPRRYPRTPVPSRLASDECPPSSIVSDSILNEADQSATSTTEADSFLNSPSVRPAPLDPTTGALRSEVQELRHALRLKNAKIALLEQGERNGTAIKISLPNGDTPPLSSMNGRSLRKRHSMQTTMRASSPVPDALQNGHNAFRRRRDAGAEPLGLKDLNQPRQRVLSGNGPPSPGYMVPTNASEKRRQETLTQVANGIVSARHRPESRDQPDQAARVIGQLNFELETTRGQHEVTKQKLEAAHRTYGQLQRTCETLRDSVTQAKQETDRQAAAVKRKERLHDAAVERARKAEAESKELGRASREWGTRVRQVEAELGDVRRQCAKAEAGYEAITSAWKNRRQHWEKEVGELRKQLQDVIKEHRDQARVALQKFEAVEQEWKGREGQRQGLEAVLEGLRQERLKAKAEVVKVADDLTHRLTLHEKARIGQEDEVQEVRDELTRIKRLMRAGVMPKEE